MLGYSFLLGCSKLQNAEAKINKSKVFGGTSGLPRNIYAADKVGVFRNRRATVDPMKMTTSYIQKT
jgi:hypothetical protein